MFYIIPEASLPLLSTKWFLKRWCQQRRWQREKKILCSDLLLEWHEAQTPNVPLNSKGLKCLDSVKAIFLIYLSLTSIRIQANATYANPHQMAIFFQAQVLLRHSSLWKYLKSIKSFVLKLEKASFTQTSQILIMEMGKVLTSNNLSPLKQSQNHDNYTKP